VPWWPHLGHLKAVGLDSDQNVLSMIKISLTDFVDIASKSGTPKATKVAQVKARPDYDARFDFYKPIRDQITEIHRAGQGGATLSHFPSDTNRPQEGCELPWAGRRLP
jgi:hypothetical protein